MASTPTPPPPQCSSIPARPNSIRNNSNSHGHNHNHHQHHRSNGHNHYLRKQENSRWNSSRYSSFANNSPLPYGNAAGSGSGLGFGAGAAGGSAAAAAASASASAAVAAAAAGGTTPAAFSSTLGFLGGRSSGLGPEFSGRRSTRFVAKMHSGRPRRTTNKVPHSAVADEALHCLTKAGNDTALIDNVLLSFEHRMSNGEDYVYLIKESGNRDLHLQATRTYDFAMAKEYGWFITGKLTSTMISVHGKLRRLENAWRLFDYARKEGFGNTVYCFSSMISAFGHNGRFHDAVWLFQCMKELGIMPNLVTYNSIIDAAAKSKVEFGVAVKYFDEMAENGVTPDRVTYNSLLCVCVPWGLWEVARDLFSEMRRKGHVQDVYTYNTYLDSLCKGGQLDFARKILADMPARNVYPNVVTYSTVMDGYAKAGQCEEALVVYEEMKRMSIPSDRVSYNTLIAVYGRLGWFEKVAEACREMVNCGFTKDIVTYNALLGGYGKHGMYDDVRRTYEEMRRKNVYPNTLTYSTLINVFTKGGMYSEAMYFYREFKQKDLEVDVVFYSALIDALCKNGLVESAMVLLDVMTKNGIRPNVITYNSIIDAFGDVAALECGFDSSSQATEHQIESSSSRLIAGPFQNRVVDNVDDRIMKIFEQLAVEKAGHVRKDKRVRQENFSILWLFQKMHELEIKPNVVTFSAILNACSRCNSFEDASKLLDQLRLFDNQVYGVAHGLLMGHRETIWFQAQSLFNEIKRMDSSTGSAFYNALTDMLWNFGQKRGAQLVVMEGRRRNVWNGNWSESCLDLHLMSCGAACAMVHAWLLNIHSVVFEGTELPKLISILTGWGKHSKVVGDGTLKKAIEALLNGIGAPFKIAECNIGRFISPGYVVAAWLKQSSTMNVLVLHDHIGDAEPAAAQMNNLQLQAT